MDSCDLSNKINELLASLDPETLTDLDVDELLEMRKEINPYGRTIEGSNKYLTFSYTNLQEKYNNRLHVTAFIAFLNRMCDEWHVPSNIPVIPVFDYVENPSLLEDFHKDWKMTEDLERDIEDNRRWMAKRVVVKEFLEEMFQFNPDEHVRSAYRPQLKDDERTVIDTPASNAAVDRLKKKDLGFKEQMYQYERLYQINNLSKSHVETPLRVALSDLQDKKLLLPNVKSEMMDFSTWSAEDKNLLGTVCNMIPPEDTFYRFRNYFESNYDRLRDAVTHLYCEKPDFDIAFNPYQWHDTREEAEQFQKKHKKEVIAEIFIADSGKWNFVAPFEKVRKTMKYFNENTIVLEQILSQVESDSKLGSELVMNKIENIKDINRVTDGPDAESFKKWKAQNSTLKNLGAQTLDDQDDCPDDVIEVPVWKIAKGGLELTKSKFYSKAFPINTE